jgi:hypothetical protein
LLKTALAITPEAVRKGNGKEKTLTQEGFSIFDSIGKLIFRYGAVRFVTTPLGVFLSNFVTPCEKCANRRKLMAQRKNTSRSKTPSYILIGNGFDEMEVVTFLHIFRQAGLGIKSISLHDKLVYSQQGVALKADLLLADTTLNLHQQCLFILPAAGRNGETLRHDARVKSLLEALSDSKSAIAVTDGNSSLADDVAAQIAPPHRPKPGENLDAFIQSLVERLLFTN